MSLFFDAAWSDARLSERGLDRAALAEAASLPLGVLLGLFTNERSSSPQELAALARALQLDLVEVSLRAGVAARAPASDVDASARIESIEARLDAMDVWLAEFEQETRKRA